MVLSEMDDKAHQRDVSTNIFNAFRRLIVYFCLETAWNILERGYKTEFLRVNDSFALLAFKKERPQVRVIANEVS